MDAAKSGGGWSKMVELLTENESESLGE